MSNMLNPIGDWAAFEKLQPVVKVLPALLEKIVASYLTQIGIKGQQFLKAHIVSQDLGWTDLNEKYKASKIAAGFSGKIYERTGFFFDNITTRIYKRRVFIGVKKGLNHPDSKKALTDIAELMEYGGFVGGGKRPIYVPARPLFRPTMEDLIRDIIRKEPLNKVTKNVLLKSIGKLIL